MTLSDTLATGLGEYQIGPKIRALRVKKGLGQTQLGEHTGLSAALLSKIERGQLFPTLPTLLRIAMVFGVGLDFFFQDSDQKRLLVITRGKDRMRLPNVPGAAAPSFYFESLDFPAADRKMDAYFAQFPASAAPSEPHEHVGTELIYVIAGKLLVRCDLRDTVLAQGDAMHFDSTAPHSYHGCEPDGATAIVVALRAG
jgi:transcriptional regulator with XRE-family HTH domain